MGGKCLEMQLGPSKCRLSYGLNGIEGYRVGGIDKMGGKWVEAEPGQGEGKTNGSGRGRVERGMF